MFRNSMPVEPRSVGKRSVMQCVGMIVISYHPRTIKQLHQITIESVSTSEIPSLDSTTSPASIETTLKPAVTKVDSRIFFSSILDQVKGIFWNRRRSSTADHSSESSEYFYNSHEDGQSDTSHDTTNHQHVGESQPLDLKIFVATNSRATEARP